MRWTDLGLKYDGLSCTVIPEWDKRERIHTGSPSLFAASWGAVSPTRRLEPPARTDQGRHYGPVRDTAPTGQCLYRS